LNSILVEILTDEEQRHGGTISSPELASYIIYPIPRYCRLPTEKGVTLEWLWAMIELEKVLDVDWYRYQYPDSSDAVGIDPGTEDLRRIVKSSERERPRKGSLKRKSGEGVEGQTIATKRVSFGLDNQDGDKDHDEGYTAAETLESSEAPLLNASKEQAAAQAQVVVSTKPWQPKAKAPTFAMDCSLKVRRILHVNRSYTE
jgi:hypothetical protein